MYQFLFNNYINFALFRGVCQRKVRHRKLWTITYAGQINDGGRVRWRKFSHLNNIVSLTTGLPPLGDVLKVKYQILFFYRCFFVIQILMPSCNCNSMSTFNNLILIIKFLLYYWELSSPQNWRPKYNIVCSINNNQSITDSNRTVLNRWLFSMQKQNIKKMQDNLV